MERDPENECGALGGLGESSSHLVTEEGCDLVTWDRPEDRVANRRVLDTIRPAHQLVPFEDHDVAAACEFEDRGTAPMAASAAHACRTSSLPTTATA